MNEKQCLIYIFFFLVTLPANLLKHCIRVWITSVQKKNKFNKGQIGFGVSKTKKNKILHITQKSAKRKQNNTGLEESAKRNTRKRAPYQYLSIRTNHPIYPKTHVQLVHHDIDHFRQSNAAPPLYGRTHRATRFIKTSCHRDNWQ